MKLAGIMYAEEFKEYTTFSKKYIDGLRGERWLYARPTAAFFSTHLRAIWLVATGKADALVWGGDQ